MFENCLFWWFELYFMFENKIIDKYFGSVMTNRIWSLSCYLQAHSIFIFETRSMNYKMLLFNGSPVPNSSHKSISLCSLIIQLLEIDFLVWFFNSFIYYCSLSHLALLKMPVRGGGMVDHIHYE